MRVIAILALLLAGLSLPVTDARAQSDPPGSEFVINLRDTELRIFAEQVSDITGRTLVLDPSVQGTVTVISGESLDADGVWRLFQTVLRSQGFATMRAGTLWRVAPVAAIVQGGATLDQSGQAAGSDFVTRLIPLATLQAEAAAAALRPTLAQFGTIQPIAQPNAIIVTDSADNVDRIQSLAALLDREERVEPDVASSSSVTIPLQFGQAETIAASIQGIVATEATATAGTAPRITADARSNTLLVRADPAALEEIRGLVAQLDRPGVSTERSLTTIALLEADAVSVAAAIVGVVSNEAAIAAGTAPQVSADPRSNTLLVRADPTTLAEIRALVLQLDRPGTVTTDSLTTITLREADAVSVAAAISSVIAGAGAGDPATAGTSVPQVSADARSNTLLVRANPTALAEIRALAAQLDQPGVIRDESLTTVALFEADAAGVAAALREIFGAAGAVAATGEGATLPGAAPGAPRIASDPRTNSLLVRADPVTTAEVVRLARQLDQRTSVGVTTIPLQFAEALVVAEAVRGVVDDAQTAGRTDAPRLSVDPRSNTLLVRATPEMTQRIRAIAADLDQPGAAAVVPVTRVVRLRHADAEVITEILRGIVGQEQATENPVANALRPDPGERITPLTLAVDRPGEDGGISPVPALNGQNGQPGQAPDAPARNPDSEVAIQSAPEINAVVLRGPPDAVARMEGLISQLDQRRPQVLIEAAIVEITGDAAEQLGIQFGAGQGAFDGAIATSSFGTAGVALSNVLGVLGVPQAALLGQGLTVGLGFEDGFGILLQALATSSKANLLSTPSLTTLDNQTAEIVVGQEVPFRTGSFTIGGNAADPFTTIDREDVGITLRVSPRVNAGDVVRLDVEQEVSSLVNANVQGAADLVTNRRSIETTVLADNREIIVLGGLITDDRISTESKIPVLGDIPVAGRLFRADAENRTKRTLFVFLRPTILRNPVDAARVSETSYGRLRAAEFAPIAEGSMILDPTRSALPLEIGGLY